MKRNKMQSQIKNFLIIQALAVAILGSSTKAQAQYANAPIWANMDMLTVSFNTTSDTLAVEPQASGRLGTNPILLGAAPNGTFDPTKPWGVLNGTAYSRSLGWYDPNSKSSTLNVLSEVQTAYGSSASVWIGLVSETAGLESFLAVGKYGVNSLGTTNSDGTPVINPAANSYSGIFGTAGSSLNWQWDGQMDHNAYAVPLADLTTPNEVFTATYKVYVGDASGNDIAPSADATETWTWTGPATVPEPATLSLSALSVAGLLVFRKLKS
jgi:hypothetical protein